MMYAGIAALVICVWGVITYNRFVSLGRRAGEAWSGISVQLKRRHDLIPNLVEIVKSYAAHESELFSRVAELRAATAAIGAEAPSRELGRGEGELGSLLGRLFAVSEAYPELRASENFIHLHQALFDAEEQLQMARRYYNGTVRNYMILYESFPSMLLPKLFSFESKEYFELESDTEKLAPSVSLS
ncbi:LemA family protein [Desulfovibrio sp. OttesenSCG-928-O18]|nr:LemA family protein [Desulfovibrio sp. OttesenSCG-928-O18]